MKFLYITHLSGKRVNRFWLSSIQAVHNLNGEFHLACNMHDSDKQNFLNDCKNLGITPHQIDFNRNPLNRENKIAYKELIELLEKENFDIIHCNTPVGGLVGRLAAHKVNNAFIIYQAHGFHFWKGAPLKNWIFYYPVEKMLSRYTDILITINKEDYFLSKKFHAKKNVFVHGVGVNLESFKYNKAKRVNKRQELGLNDNDIAILSVGELIPRKNHKIVIEAINELKNKPEFKRIQYYICGTGELKEELTSFIKENNLCDHVHLLGYRLDVSDIYCASDIFAFMSYQEGLPVAIMEAMASGLPIVASNIRGNNDLIEDGVNGFLVNNSKYNLAQKLDNMILHPDKIRIFGQKARNDIQQYSYEKVVDELTTIYSQAH